MLLFHIYFATLHPNIAHQGWEFAAFQQTTQYKRQAQKHLLTKWSNHYPELKIFSRKMKPSILVSTGAGTLSRCTMREVQIFEALFALEAQKQMGLDPPQVDLNLTLNQNKATHDYSRYGLQNIRTSQEKNVKAMRDGKPLCNLLHLSSYFWMHDMWIYGKTSWYRTKLFTGIPKLWWFKDQVVQFSR